MDPARHSTASPDDGAKAPSKAPSKERFWLTIIGIVSVGVAAGVAFLILGPRPSASSLDVSGLPLVNASLNGLTTILLVTGIVFIKRGDERMHRKLMLATFTTSVLFLVSYVIYHGFKAGPRPYTGELRGLYLTILLSHIVLAAAIIPLALVTLYRGFMGQRAKHRSLARVTFPIWLYVSLTGVLIYLMLY